MKERVFYYSNNVHTSVNKLCKSRKAILASAGFIMAYFESSSILFEFICISRYQVINFIHNFTSIVGDES